MIFRKTRWLQLWRNFTRRDMKKKYMAVRILEKEGKPVIENYYCGGVKNGNNNTSIQKD